MGTVPDIEVRYTSIFIPVLAQHRFDWNTGKFIIEALYKQRR